MNYKKLFKSLIEPPAAVAALLVPLCAAALVWVFVTKRQDSPVAYAVYILSFYTLCVVTWWCIKHLPKQYRTAKDKLYSNPVGNRYMTDMKFRTHVNLYLSLSVNLLYVAVNVVSGIIFETAWFFVLSFYYTILAVMRFLLLRFVGRTGIGNDRRGELLRSRLCGVILLTVNLALTGAVMMILYVNKGFSYNGILIYVVASYTFYITAMAIRNLIKYRRLGSPVMSMSKIISMAAALVSMLSLETAMFSQFGKEMSQWGQRLMIILTGAGVSAVIITMSLYSIIKNTKELKKQYEQ